MKHPHQPPDQRVMYPRATTAGNPRRTSLGAAAWIAAACAAAIVLVVLLVVAVVDNPATGAADRAAVASSRPTATPGPPVPPHQPEYSPPLADTIPGDGTWLVGKEIKRGTYRTEGGMTCYWARLADLSGEFEAVLANGFRRGQQIVAMGTDDAAFASQGCGQWVMVR